LAYEGKGQPSQARSEFGRFLEVWKDADPDIPEVILARQRLAASVKPASGPQPSS
jgi:hypothetical protein